MFETAKNQDMGKLSFPYIPHVKCFAALQGVNFVAAGPYSANKASIQSGALTGVTQTWRRNLLDVSHYCPDWNFDLIYPDSCEALYCKCRAITEDGYGLKDPKNKGNEKKTTVKQAQEADK